MTDEENMTRGEFEGLMTMLGQEAIRRDRDGDMLNFLKSLAVDRVWTRIDAIQNRPFQPDWSLKPSWAIGFSGRFIGLDEYGKDPQGPGEFYIPAPHNPTDAELVAMFDKLDLDKKLEVLRDAGVVM